MNKEWKNLFAGEPAFILGCGPSLDKSSLGLLDNFLTIGINHIFWAYDPTVLFWQDKQVWLENSNQIIDINAIKLAPHVPIKKKYTSDIKMLLKKLNDGPDEKFIECKIENMRWVHPNLVQGCQKKGFYTFSRSNADIVGSAALVSQLAMFWGCSALVLLGVDCKYDGNKTNFYGQNTHHSFLSLNVCNRSMAWLKRNCALPVYNCGNINMFPKYDLESIVDKFQYLKKDRDYFYDKIMHGIEDD